MVRDYLEQGPSLLKLLLQSILDRVDGAETDPRWRRVSSQSPTALSAIHCLALSADLRALRTQPPTGPAGITFAAPPTDPYEGFATDRPKDGCWVGLWQAGPTVNARSGRRGSSLPASVEYTAPTFSFKTYAEKSATVTAFIDEKWYQSTFKLAICTAGC